MSIVSAFGESFGYYSPESYENSELGKARCEASDTEYDEDDYKEQATTLTCLNVLGYIPVVGAASALCRLAFIAKTKGIDSPDSAEEHTQNLHLTIIRVVQVIRAIFEFLGAGIVFLLPDLLVSAAHYFFTCCGRVTTTTST